MVALLCIKRKIALLGNGEIAVIMKYRILSWNVRGLNDRDERLRISNLLRLWKVDIVCFQETKLVSISNCLVQSLWGCPYVVGAMWTLEVLREVFFLCGIAG
jgi:hypothetical protein